MTPALPRTALASFLTAFLGACNGSASSDATGGDSVKQSETPDKNEPPQPAANTFESPTTEQLDELAASLAGHLASAREATDPAGRIAALERAVALAPFDPATLAELGRSQFAADQLFEAMRSFELALRHSDDIPQRAAVLVELGILAEAVGNPTRAAELYNSSVTLHPTEAGAARLAARTGGVEVISHTTCEWTRHGPAAPQLCPAYVQAHGAAPSTCGYTYPPLVVDADTRVELFSHQDPSGEIEFYVLNAIIGGVWYSSPLTWVSHPAAEHADENVAKIDLRLERVAPEPKPQVVIEYQLERRTVDPTTKLLDTRTTTNLGVLSIGSIEPRWWLGLRTASSRSVRPHAESGKVTLTQTSVEVKWITKTGDLELLRTEHSPSGTLGKFPLGAYTLLCPGEIDGS